MTSVEFHPEAAEEVVEARNWYFERSPVAAASLSHELDRTIRRISEDPDLYREDLDGNRRFVLDRFPFTIVYRRTNSVLTVIAFAHQKRRPRYWSDRSPGR